MTRRVVLKRGTLAIELPGIGPLPSEFRLFTVGLNKTDNGDFFFDAADADSVMAAYGAHAVDLMVDLEHLSLDPKALNFDPDARAWLQLELRDGELWAVNVRWTDDGSARLRSKKQRYISPAFLTDADGHVTKIINIGLTALPATHGTQELIAARVALDNDKTAAALAVGGAGKMDPELVKQALDAITEGDAAAAIDLLKGIIASAASIEPVEPAAVAVDVEMDAEAEGDAEAAADDEEEPDANREELAAARAQLIRLSGQETLGAALGQVEVWRRSHVDAEANAAKIHMEVLALELGERRKLVAELIRLRCEDPSTAWEDFASDKPCLPVERLRAEPIAKLRDRVAKLSKARGGAAAAVVSPAPPKGAGVKTVTVRGKAVKLSAQEQAQLGGDEAQIERYAAIKLNQGSTGPITTTTTEQ